MGDSTAGGAAHGSRRSSRAQLGRVTPAQRSSGVAGEQRSAHAGRLAAGNFTQSFFFFFFPLLFLCGCTTSTPSPGRGTEGQGPSLDLHSGLLCSGGLRAWLPAASPVPSCQRPATGQESPLCPLRCPPRALPLGSCWSPRSRFPPGRSKSRQRASPMLT